MGAAGNVVGKEGEVLGPELLYMKTCRVGFLEKWSQMKVVSHQGDLSSGWPLIRWSVIGMVTSLIRVGSDQVVSHRGGLSAGWSLIRVVSDLDGLLTMWSLIRVVFVRVVSLIRVVF